MKGLQIKTFGQLPVNCRIWVAPTAGTWKNYLLFGIKQGDRFTVLETKQVCYPLPESPAITEKSFDINPYLESLLNQIKIKNDKQMATKTKKKVAKKKVTSKKSVRTANADLINSIVAGYALSIDNKTVAEKTKLSVKQVRDSRYRIAQKKKAK